MGEVKDLIEDALNSNDVIDEIKDFLFDSLNEFDKEHLKRLFQGKSKLVLDKVFITIGYRYL